MEITPYKREVPKRTSTSTSSGKKRKHGPSISSMLKSGKGKKRPVDEEGETVDDHPGTPPKKRAKFVHNGSSEDKAPTLKSKRKGSNKAPERLKNEALPRLPLKDGFRSAKDMVDAFANEDTSSSEPESLSQIRNSTKCKRDASPPLLDTDEIASTLSSVAKTNTNSVSAHQRLKAKPTTGGSLPQASDKSGRPNPKDHRSHVSSASAKNVVLGHISTSSNSTAIRPEGDRSMKWLMDSDSDTESLDANVKPPKVTGKGSLSPIIDLDDDDEIHPVGDARQSAPESLTIVSLSSSPAPPRPPPRVDILTLDDPDLSMSQPAMRRLKRRMDADAAARLMPPLPRPSKLPATETSPVASPVVSSKKKSRPAHSLLNGHEFLEIEAEHSGDEIEAGSSDAEGVENDSDRQFAGDFDMSQVADAYDQPNVYRQSLFTQVPPHGPFFINRPVRSGAFAGGRAWQRPVGIPSSSPRNEEPDEYSFGSFVVHDEEELHYDTSSSQIQVETDTI